MHWKLCQFGKRIYFKRFHNGSRIMFLNARDGKCFFSKNVAKTCSCWLKICILQNYRPLTGHRQPTTDTQQVVHRQSITDQRLTDRSSTNPTTTDHQLTDRFSTDTPTHRVSWPPTTWLNQTYFNRGRLLVVGGLSVVCGFVIRSQNFKEHWNQVSLLS